MHHAADQSREATQAQMPFGARLAALIRPRVQSGRLLEGYDAIVHVGEGSVVNKITISICRRF